MREILKLQCRSYKPEMVAVLSRVSENIVAQDVNPGYLDRSIDNVLLKLTRKPTRRVSKPKPSNLWHEKFERFTRRKRKRAGAESSQKKTTNRQSPRCTTSLSKTSDKRINKKKREIKFIADRQQEHVCKLESSGSCCVNEDEAGEDHVCSICLHSTAEQQGHNIARLDCFHEFCRPCIELWFAVDRKQVTR